MTASPINHYHDVPHLYGLVVRNPKKNMTLERPFGGLNVVTSGDAWQFGPIGSNAVYDNYNKLPKRASVQTIAAMCWKHELDSFNCFRELTVERRCKDPWS